MRPGDEILVVWMVGGVGWVALWVRLGRDWRRRDGWWSGIVTYWLKVRRGV